jgi:hypothetical protein
MDTKLSTIPNAPASDRSPVAKMQTLRRDGSDPLTPERTPSLAEMSDELGPSNLLSGNATTADEAEQMTEAVPRKIPSTHETMTTQTSTPKHDQKQTMHITCVLDACPGMHVARSAPPPCSFPRRNALLYSPTDPTSRPLSALTAPAPTTTRCEGQNMELPDAK